MTLLSETAWESSDGLRGRKATERCNTVPKSLRFLQQAGVQWGAAPVKKWLANVANGGEHSPQLVWGSGQWQVVCMAASPASGEGEHKTRTDLSLQGCSPVPLLPGPFLFVCHLLINLHP